MFKEDDIQAVAEAMRAYDETVEDKKWRDLAIVAITAMGKNIKPVAPTLELETVVANIHKEFKPETFGDNRVLDRICSILLGDEGYATWLSHVGHQAHD